MIYYLAATVTSNNLTPGLNTYLILVGFAVTIIVVLIGFAGTRHKSTAIEVKVDGQMTRMQTELDSMTNRIRQLDAALKTAGVDSPEATGEERTK